MDVSMDIRPAKVSELEEIAELQHIVFRPNEAESPARYLAYAKEDPTYTLDHSRVIETDGRIVAHLRIWDRTMRVRGVSLLAAGIGSLCVHPNYRKQGYAQALMRDTEGYFLQAGYDFGLLFTIIGTPYYEAQNWITIPLPTFTINFVDVTRESLDVRPLEIEKDLDAVMHIHEVDGMHGTGSVVRDRNYWTNGPARIRGLFPKWGVVRNGEVVAYVNFVSDGDGVWVKEACALPNESLAYADLASLVLNKCNGKLSGSLPHRHAFVHTLETMSQSTATWSTYDEMMVKGVNWHSLREKLGADVVPSPQPKSEAQFWTDLFGDDVFYWETDFF
jgi:predicted N-acetyltransferase YhbS